MYDFSVCSTCHIEIKKTMWCAKLFPYSKWKIRVTTPLPIISFDEAIHYENKLTKAGIKINITVSYRKNEQKADFFKSVSLPCFLLKYI